MVMCFQPLERERESVCVCVYMCVCVCMCVHVCACIASCLNSSYNPQNIPTMAMAPACTHTNIYTEEEIFGCSETCLRTTEPELFVSQVEQKVQCSQKELKRGRYLEKGEKETD